MSKLNEFRWKAYIAWLAAKRIPRINLGDRVWYQGEQYVVSNAAWLDSYRLAYLPPPQGWLKNGRDGLVPSKECRKVWDVRNCIGSFKGGWRFFMGYWYHIWLHQGRRTASSRGR